MYFDLANILVFAGVAVGFIVGNLVVNWILSKKRPYPEKLTPYECGEDTIGTSWIQFNIRFYVIALIFLIFDVEIALLFPWTLIFKEPGVSGIALVEMFTFILILVVGFAYVWVKGDLEWLKSIGTVEQSKKERGA